MRGKVLTAFMVAEVTSGLLGAGRKVELAGDEEWMRCTHPTPYRRVPRVFMSLNRGRDHHGKPERTWTLRVT